MKPRGRVKSPVRSARARPPSPRKSRSASSAARFQPILPPELAQVARAVCLADLDCQFEFGLQALLTGIEA